MKGDDVVLFDLDLDFVRIIVGESKLKDIPDRKWVVDIDVIKSYAYLVPKSIHFGTYK